MFVQDLARLLKNKARASKFQEIQGMNLNPTKLYLMFGLEKP